MGNLTFLLIFDQLDVVESNAQPVNFFTLEMWQRVKTNIQDFDLLDVAENNAQSAKL